MKGNLITRTAVLSFAVVALTSGPAAAQNRDGGARRANPEQFVDHQVQRLDQQLELTDAQEAELRQILAERATDVQARMAQQRENQQANREANRELMRAQMEETDRAIAALLTSEQQEKYAALKAERGEQMAQRREQMAQRRERMAQRGEQRRGRGQGFMQELNLTEEQRTQIRDIRTAQQDRVRAWREANPNATQAERREYIGAQFNELNAAIEALLTPEQAEKFRAHRQEMQDRPQQRRGSRRAGRGQNAPENG